MYVLPTSFVALILLGGYCLSADASVEFTLQRYNRNIAANSVIDISRVGRKYSHWYYNYYTYYTNEGPLVCHTDDQYCCRDIDDPVENEENGEWYFPNGHVVDSGERYGSFYVTRGHQELSLHSYSAYGPTGVYCCDIQSVNASGNITADFVSQTNLTYVNSSTSMCIGLYTNSQLRICPDISLSNGFVRYDSPYIPGRVASFSCNNGFSVVGGRYSTCSSWGWSVGTPRCVYDCGPLLAPKNGQIVFSSGTTAGSVATYSCDKGYHLMGATSRYCQYSTYSYYRSYSRNGWSNTEPYCADEAKIQLLFSPSDYCLDWSASKAALMESALVNKIQQVISDYSPELATNASLPRSNIKPGFFSCRSSLTEVTFRTTIVGLRNVSAVTVADTIQRWVLTGPSVRVNWYVVDIDRNCPVAINDEYGKECMSDFSIQNCIDKCFSRKENQELQIL